MELCSNVMWQPGWEGGLGRMDTCMCMAESLLYAHESITILLIGYTPISKIKVQIQTHQTQIGP